ncbi:hypothetical protein AAC387_Pa05g2120 [Persea americana]
MKTPPCTTKLNQSPFSGGKRLRSSFFNKRSGSNLPPLISLLLGYRIADTRIEAFSHRSAVEKRKISCRW